VGQDDPGDNGQASDAAAAAAAPTTAAARSAQGPTRSTAQHNIIHHSRTRKEKKGIKKTARAGFRGSE
jgi:hypothetical protein